MIKVGSKLLLAVSLSVVSISSGFCMDAPDKTLKVRRGKTTKPKEKSDVVKSLNTKGKKTKINSKITEDPIAEKKDPAQEHFKGAVQHLRRVADKRSGLNHEELGVDLLKKAVALGSIDAETIALSMGYALYVTQSGGNRVLAWPEDND